MVSIHPFINMHKAAVIIKYTQYGTTENIQKKMKNKYVLKKDEGDWILRYLAYEVKVNL